MALVKLKLKTMGRKKLSDEEIKLKLQEGRNYKRLYSELKARFDDAQAEIKQLKNENIEQRVYFETIIETQNARISELETMVFGRKPKGGLKAKVKAKDTRAPRSNDSYRRPLPPASAITNEQHHGIADCHRCGTVLADKDEAIRYEEDIVLAALTPELPQKNNN